MNKESIIKGVDELSSAKKNSSLFMKLIIGFAAFIVIAILCWAYSVQHNAMNKIIVVDRSGEYLKITVDENEKLFISLLSNHCAQTVYYANSFDRLSINENQAKAAFLASKDNLNRIFAMYNQQRAYGDALERGVVYKCEFKEMLNVAGDKEPYQVMFSSVLTITDEYAIKKILITSKGELIRVKSRYPENVTGFYFKNYIQEYQNIVETKGEGEGNE